MFFSKTSLFLKKSTVFYAKNCRIFLEKVPASVLDKGLFFFKNILVFEKSTVFPIEKLSQAFASPLPCGQGIGKGAQPDTAESSGRRRKPEPWKARFLRTSPQKWPLKKSGNTFQQMKDVKLYIHFQGFWLTDFSHTWCIAEILSKRFKPLFVECCTVEG